MLLTISELGSGFVSTLAAAAGVVEATRPWIERVSLLISFASFLYMYIQLSLFFALKDDSK